MARKQKSAPAVVTKTFVTMFPTGATIRTIDVTSSDDRGDGTRLVNGTEVINTADIICNFGESMIVRSPKLVQFQAASVALGVAKDGAAVYRIESVDGTKMTFFLGRGMDIQIDLVDGTIEGGEEEVEETASSKSKGKKAPAPVEEDDEEEDAEAEEDDEEEAPKSKGKKAAKEEVKSKGKKKAEPEDEEEEDEEEAPKSKGKPGKKTVTGKKAAKDEDDEGDDEDGDGATAWGWGKNGK